MYNRYSSFYFYQGEDVILINLYHTEDENKIDSITVSLDITGTFVEPTVLPDSPYTFEEDLSEY